MKSHEITMKSPRNHHEHVGKSSHPWSFFGGVLLRHMVQASGEDLEWPLGALLHRRAAPPWLGWPCGFWVGCFFWLKRVETDF